MKIYSDYEFTLVTPRSFAECAEALRQMSLFSELMGNKKKKNYKDTERPDRNFAYKFRSGITSLNVTGTVEPYEQPYTGCRIAVCLSEGTATNAVNLFTFYVIVPLFLLLLLMEQEYALAAGLAGVACAAVGKWHYFDKPHCKRTQELLAALFGAAVESAKQEIHEDA